MTNVITRVIDRAGLDSLMTSLREDGFTVIGPTVQDHAIVYDTLDTTNDLPVGWGDEQDGGTYRLTEREDDALFGHNLGPMAWRRHLSPPKVELLRIRSSEDGLEFEPTSHEPTKHAFVGVRACELAAIAIQDQVFMGPYTVDPTYASRRQGLLVIAVNCGTAAATCFCTSMGTGPRATSGYDVVLTEISAEDGFAYVLESGSDAGADLIDRLGRQAGDADLEAIDSLIESTESSMVRSIDTTGLHEFLLDNLEHPEWDEVAARCLTCGNCTFACPTCFCSTMTDSVSLDGVASRTRVWDSCFGLDFSSIHRHPVRGSAKSRYRQWMTHKLATWQDQFGSIGCVGCGRCITWCPVGIDITAVVRTMREEVPV